MQKINFRARWSRRMPDPIRKNAQRQILFMSVLDMPELPKDPNPREQNTDRLIWRQIKRHLLNEEGTPNTFHLKNKGISILADSIKQVKKGKAKDEADEYEVCFKSGDGVVDGGHTYELIRKTIETIKERIENGEEIDQYVKVELLVGYPRNVHTEIAGGLNTAIQVQLKSLADSDGDFQWIKEALKSKKHLIAFRENEKDRSIGIEEIICALYVMNIVDFPNDSSHPLKGYNSKSGAMKHYLANVETYKRLRPIIKDILVLRDLIAAEGMELHREHNNGRNSIAFVDTSKPTKPYKFMFSQKEKKERLKGAAMLPMLAAFRCMIIEDEDTKQFRWRKNFAEVKKLWQKVGAKLMKATQNVSMENNRKVHLIGRSTNHWNQLYITVKGAYTDQLLAELMKGR